MSGRGRPLPAADVSYLCIPIAVVRGLKQSPGSRHPWAGHLREASVSLTGTRMVS